VGDALAALYREYPDLRFLGSYAQAEPVPTRVPAEFTDAAYRSGRAWVESLRSR
ncbi:prephenate dehydratase, partial [Xanthomonas citri pv. citri]|nr:prephenate dehydratase [Xanthomonas citri pv. citri]